MSVRTTAPPQTAAGAVARSRRQPDRRAAGPRHHAQHVQPASRGAPAREPRGGPSRVQRAGKSPANYDIPGAEDRLGQSETSPHNVAPTAWQLARIALAMMHMRPGSVNVDHWSQRHRARSRPPEAPAISNYPNPENRRAQTETSAGSGGLQHTRGHALDLGDRGQALAHLLQAVLAQALHAFLHSHGHHLIHRGALEDQRADRL
jgi:hypothetical protein